MLGVPVNYCLIGQLRKPNKAALGFVTLTNYKTIYIDPEEEIILNLIQLEKNFWENHVMKNIMPSPDGSKLADSVISECFKNSIDKTITLNGFDEKLQRREELVKLLDKLETEKKLIEQEVKLYLGDAEKAESDSYRISWKSLVSSRLDTKALQEQEPHIYQKYLKQTTSRRFTVKAA